MPNSRLAAWPFAIVLGSEAAATAYWVVRLSAPETVIDYTTPCVQTRLRAFDYTAWSEVLPTQSESPIGAGHGNPSRRAALFL